MQWAQGGAQPGQGFGMPQQGSGRPMYPGMIPPAGAGYGQRPGQMTSPYTQQRFAPGNPNRYTNQGGVPQGLPPQFADPRQLHPGQGPMQPGPGQVPNQGGKGQGGFMMPGGMSQHPMSNMMPTDSNQYGLY
jgi:hypothetical protein